MFIYLYETKSQSVLFTFDEIFAMALNLPPPNDEDRASVAEAGLCASCAHLRVLRSRSVFVRCARADSDADSRFPRYPVLPVLECPGWESGA